MLLPGFRTMLRVAILLVITIVIAVAALYGLISYPISNGCIMTYMYPTYIPISSDSMSSAKYGLFLYHEGWKRIDFKEHIKKLSGVPVLFIPGNGGSYKQVRSLAAESDRAYQNGPLERTFYQEASLTSDDRGVDIHLSGFKLPNQYTSKLDWYAVDLEGEHSAMDGGILQEHTEYVVYAIHKILDQYKASYDARAREGTAASGSLPKSVILVGHSMGGFVARAAVVHPRLRKSAVETILTLSSPHQSPPISLQPSLGRYFACINEEWRKGYKIQTTSTGRHMSDPLLSHVVVISISGGYYDYQVRSQLESLDGIVPPTHGFIISSTAMRNVWLSMEHQSILWCNQLVVQVSHTLLSLIDSRTGHPLPDTQKRLEVFTRMLHSGVSQSFKRMMQSHSSQLPINAPIHNIKDMSGLLPHSSPACPSKVHWNDEGLERDLYIQTTMVTVLAMDGRRRWLDIQKLGSNGKSNFIFVTNLVPCSGVRLHLWPEKGTTSSLPLAGRVVEVTSKMMQIPSRPAPTQMEPGSQTEQAPPSAVFWLGPDDLRGFRFLTISVAPRLTFSGGPPPAASMAVGQFFNPEEGKQDLSTWLMLQSTYSQKEILLKEDHPLLFNLSFATSLGLLPVTLSLKTAGCGIRDSGLPDEEAGDDENNRLCKLRCFPPVALAWDDASGLHIFSNLQSETIFVDSSPAFWGLTQHSEKTTVLLLVDPHCSYKTSIAVSVTGAASRFFLLYNSKIVGFSFSVIFFALMRQAYAWDLDLPIPSMLTVMVSNLTSPTSFLYQAILPIFFYLLLCSYMAQIFPPIASFICISVLCYVFANGLMALLVCISHLVFSIAASVHVFIKRRWLFWEGNVRVFYGHWFINLSSGFCSLEVVRVLRTNPTLVTALAAMALACVVHPALGLFLVIFSHALGCHGALCSYLMASSYGHAQEKLFDLKYEGNIGSQKVNSKFNSTLNQSSSEEDSSNSPNSSKSFSDTQLDTFNHRFGLSILHLIAALMFAPSLISWLQRIGTGQSFPWFLDSVLCIGVILHAMCNLKPEFNSFTFSLPQIPIREVRLYIFYALAGCFSSYTGLAFAPYQVFYAMAAIGVISFSMRILQRMKRVGVTLGSRKHSHRH